MILTAHQPLYLPWLRLFHKIALADKFIFFDQVQYVPRSWINRNEVRTANGPVLLTVPVLSKGHREKCIAQMEINNSENWRHKHWRTLLLGYQKAPYFNVYSDFFEDVYKREWNSLSELTFYMLQWFVQTLGITTTLLKAEDYSFVGAKSDLVLDMCLKLGAQKYIFGECGDNYAEKEQFIKAGVTPIFQNYTYPTYKQNSTPFIPNLSIVDLLFNEGPNSLEILMSANMSRCDIETWGVGL